MRLLLSFFGVGSGSSWTVNGTVQSSRAALLRRNCLCRKAHQQALAVLNTLNGKTCQSFVVLTVLRDAVR